MDFGKLPSVDNVDFSLPSDPPENKLVLSGNKSSEKVKIHVGAPVWGDKLFLGKLYPPKTKSSEMLNLYSKQFKSIEMSGTYYKIPSVSDVLKWKEQVEAPFIFSPKISQIISHSLQLPSVDRLINEFCESVAHFEHMLGSSFMIAPNFITADKLGYLENFCHVFPSEIPLAVELRHESWFMNQQALSDAFDIFRSSNMTAVITDVSGRRDVCHMHLTTDVAFIRFVGSNHPSDFARLDDWAVRISEWIKAGLKECYIYIHTTPKDRVIQLSNHFIDKMNRLYPTSLKKIELQGIKDEPGLFDN